MKKIITSYIFVTENFNIDNELSDILSVSVVNLGKVIFKWYGFEVKPGEERILVTANSGLPHINRDMKIDFLPTSFVAIKDQNIFLSIDRLVIDESSCN